MLNDTGVIEADSRAEEPVADSALFIRLVDAIRVVPASERGRYVHAAMVFLGAPLDGPKLVPPNALGASGSNIPDAGTSPQMFSRRVKVWMSQNALDEGAFESAFHFSPSGVEVIAHTVPGRSNRERVRCCYLLAGVQAFLSTGDPRFDDESARAICRDLGCYDAANHATYVKALGNLLAGSKSSSYELTHPGLKAAAELIRELPSTVG
jgi:hypothetical protein